MKRPFGLTIVAIAMASALIAEPLPAAAQQDDPRNRNIPSLELDQTDIRDALRLLFRAVGVQYSIAPDVQGTITVSLRDVPFETALRNILNQADATYSVQGGVYVITKRQTETAPTLPTDSGVVPTTQTSAPIRIPINRADPQLIMLLLRGIQDTQLQPEMSSMTGGGFGGGGFGGGFGGGGFGGGGFGGGGFGGGGFGGGFGGGPSIGGGFGGGGFGGGRGGGGGGFGGGRGF